MSKLESSRRPADTQKHAKAWAEAAPAALVNRTHRVIQQRAAAIPSRRSRLRSLTIPMLSCAAVLVVVCTAVWSVLDQYELKPTGVPDASSQMLVFLLSLLPRSTLVLALFFSDRASG